MKEIYVKMNIISVIFILFVPYFACQQCHKIEECDKKTIGVRAVRGRLGNHIWG